MAKESQGQSPAPLRGIDHPVAQVTLAGCGGLYHYVMGVVAAIQKHFDLARVVYGGTSGGALIGMLVGSGLDMEWVFEDVNLPFLAEVRMHWLRPCFRWNRIARKHMLAALPADAYHRLSERLYVSLTHFPSFENRFVNAWTSNEDLVTSVIGSCFIPVNDTRPWQTFRGERYWDGTFSNNSPVPLARETTPSFVITVDMWRSFPSFWKWWSWSDETFSRYLYEAGRSDARDHLEEIAEVLPRREAAHRPATEPRVSAVEGLGAAAAPLGHTTP